MMTNKQLIGVALLLSILMLAAGCTEKKLQFGSNVGNEAEFSSIKTSTSVYSGTTTELSGTSPTSGVTSGNAEVPEIYVPDKGLIDDDGDNGGKQTTASPSGAASESTSSSGVAPASTSSTASTSQSIITYDLYPSKPAGFAGGVY